MPFTLKILAKDRQARRGIFATGHGKVQTPAFMPIATTAAIKGLEAIQAKDSGADILLANAYHLELRPGSEMVRKLGGLHKFMGWNLPILTDSGGFQVFSLQKIRKISEDGVLFNSPIDGKEMRMSPEMSMKIQVNLGTDIIMAFDECKAPDTKTSVRDSLDLTTRWAQRCKDEFLRLHKGKRKWPNKRQALFGIVQGSVFADLRKKSAEDLVKIGFDGYAIGGLAVGEDEKTMVRMIEATMPYLPENKVRYLMGVGTPVNIVEAVARGVDLFDCVLPTRNARHGHLFTSRGVLNIKNSQFKTDKKPLDPDCECDTCHQYSRAYLRHLIISGEHLGLPLLVRHNVHYYLNLMKNIRQAIEQGNFNKFRKKIHDQ